MPDLMTTLSHLLRPRLLMKAARFGLRSYDRTRHLPRLIGHIQTQSGSAAALRLVELEAELDEKRCEKDASYSVQRHVDVLTALLGEADRLRQVATLPLAAKVAGRV